MIGDALEKSGGGSSRTHRDRCSGRIPFAQGWQVALSPTGIPKWQKDNTLGRVSTQKRLQKLRSAIGAWAIEGLDGDSCDLVIDSANSTKYRELEFLLELAGIFVRVG